MISFVGVLKKIKYVLPTSAFLLMSPGLLLGIFVELGHEQGCYPLGNSSLLPIGSLIYPKATTSLWSVFYGQRFLEPGDGQLHPYGHADLCWGGVGG